MAIVDQRQAAAPHTVSVARLFAAAAFAIGAVLILVGSNVKLYELRFYVPGETDGELSFIQRATAWSLEIIPSGAGPATAVPEFGAPWSGLRCWPGSPRCS